MKFAVLIFLRPIKFIPIITMIAPPHAETSEINKSETYGCKNPDIKVNNPW